MLNGIHLVDFGNHRNTRLTFGRITALVGRNGAGKTSVLRAIHAVETVLSSGLHGRIHPAFARRGAKNVVVTASRDETGREPRSKFGVCLSVAGVNFQRLLRPEERAEIWVPDPGGEVSPGAEAVGPRPIEEWHCRYFKASASTLQRPAFADPMVTTLKDDGSNLAWVLSSLMTEHPDKFHEIVDSLKEVVPVVKGIRSRAVSMTRAEKQTITINSQARMFEEERAVAGQELIFDMISGDNLPASMVSEGTLVALAALTLVQGTDAADLIMFDDVELGLHPKAQRDLVRQLQRLQETHPQLQIILSTHSPYVIDEMKPEEVWVFAPDSSGCAVVHRLDEHPNAKRALEVLTTGEFWSAEGEGWVLEASPDTEEVELTARVAEEPPVR